ncbi:histone-lysine N-methyltransferase SETMAR [Trichonephila clavipes]|nr:histone-lysine N-methyltransferase SETMAR [Trichonephila clavipes]
MIVVKVTFYTKNYFAGFCFIHSIVSYRVLKIEVNKEKVRYILQFSFDKGENASQTSEILHGVYDAHTVTANYMQFWFRRFSSGIFDVKDVLHTGSPIVKYIDKITEINQVDRLLSSRSIAQVLQMDNKTVLSHLSKLGFKKKFDVWVPHKITPENMMARIVVCGVLAQWNEINPFLKWMVTGDEKWVTYDNIW